MVNVNEYIDIILIRICVCPPVVFYYIHCLLKSFINLLNILINFINIADINHDSQLCKLFPNLLFLVLH